MKRLLARGGPLGVFGEYPILARLALICVCAEIAWATLIAVMEFYLKEELLRDLSPQLVASRLATALLAFVGMETIFKYPMGRLADRLGARPLVLFALGLSSITPFLMYFAAHEWWHFIPLRALDGLAAAALWPAMSALMARSVPREAKSAAMSVLNAAYCLGLAVGPMCGLFLGHILHSNIYVFPLCGILMAVGFVLAFVTLGQKPAEASSPLSSTGKETNQNGEAVSTGFLRSHPMLFKMMALYAVSQIGIGILGPTLPGFLDTQFGLKQKDLSSLIVVPAILIVIIALPLGRMADHIGRARAVWISYAMATTGMVIAALSSRFHPTHGLLSFPLALFGVGMLLLAGSYILGTPAWLGLTSLQVDDSKQAQALSLMQTAQGVGVVFAFILVASGGILMTQLKHVGSFAGSVLHRHARGAVQTPTQVVTRLHDAVPISVWFWVSALVFALCLLGTLLWIHEPPHDAHSGHDSRAEENANAAASLNPSLAATDTTQM
jgi:MFS family permease